MVYLHETTDGKIVRIYGFNRHHVMWYTLTGNNGRTNLFEYGTTSIVEASKWKERYDLADFPGSVDPPLPYEFDLFFDLKTVSQLPSFLKECDSDELEEIMEMITRNKITIPPAIDDEEIEDSPNEFPEGIGR
jgi:hypothetical protein